MDLPDNFDNIALGKKELTTIRSVRPEYELDE